LTIQGFIAATVHTHINFNTLKCKYNVIISLLHYIKHFLQGKWSLC